MTRIVVVALLLVIATLAAAGGGREADLEPIAAAEAERRTLETRDFVVDMLWEHTDVHWHAGEWEECIRLCRQSVELDPHFTEAYTSGAWLLSNLNRDAEAVEMYQEAVADNPDAADVYQQFGLFYHRRKKWDEAIEQFRKAVENEAPRAWQHMLPATLAQAGRNQEALSEWRELLKRFPGDGVAKRRIGELEQELSGADTSD